MSTEQNTIATMVRAFAEIIERLLKRFENQGAEYERKLAEHRASFGARTEADRQIIEGLHVQAQDQRAENERLGKKLAGLNLQMEMQRSVDVTALAAARREGEERAAKVLQSRVQDMRDEIIRVNEAHGKTQAERDALRAEVAALQERLRADIAEELNESPPAPPEASHDTTAGKEAAASVIRNSQMTEIKVGDVVEVVSATHKIYTEPEDIGRRGVVTAIDGMRISVEAVPCYKLPIRGIVGKCDVRKVTT